MSAHPEHIKSMLDRFSDAWKTNDGATVASFFVEEGTLINPFGHRADGRTTIAALYSEYFGGLLRGTSTTITLGSVRGVEDSHAFADCEQTIHAADGNVVLAVHIAALLRNDGAGWQFVDARPYTFAAMPG